MAVTEGHVLARLDDATERSCLALAELEVCHEEARLDLGANAGCWTCA